MRLHSSSDHRLGLTLLLIVAAGCGETNGAGSAAGCLTFDHTFDAIQVQVFEKGGCTNDACHGESVSGGLDLRAGTAFEALVGVRAAGSSLSRVEPGSANESYLYHKLAAATAPDTAAEINGSPMPVNLEPLSADLLEAVRLWIVAGAPRTGSIGDTSSQSSATLSNLLGACLPDAQPIAVTPLPPPPADKGVQFEMPNFTIDSESEVELCFATYYDLSDVVPSEYQDGERFWFNGAQLRMDSQSHHLVISHSGLGEEFLDHPSFGGWTCKGGSQAGADCDPIDPGACGEGHCASEIRASVACTGYGPPEASMVFGEGIPSLGGIGSTQDVIPPIDGAFSAFPIRGILFWNSHAFNLTKQDHVMHAWANIDFTDDLRLERRTSTNVDSLYFASGTPPYTKAEVCAEQVAPLDSFLVSALSHTHKRGSDFRAWLPDGSLFYRSYNYADPLRLNLDEPLLMDDPDPAGRTMRYCAMFNNGVNEDGSPNPEKVTRASRMPGVARCLPVACADGNVGAPCQGEDDDAACDTAPGAGDGMCDACAITSGVTTENEMFVFQPAYLIPVAD